MCVVSAVRKTNIHYSYVAVGSEKEINHLQHRLFTLPWHHPIVFP